MCLVKVPVESQYGGKYAEPVEIGHVRFLPRSEASHSGYAMADGSKGMLFIDAYNSEGAFEIPERSLVSVDGGDWMAVVRNEAKPAYLNETHHWEIECR